MFVRRPGDATVRADGLELGARRPGMEGFADVDAPTARSLIAASMSETIRYRPWAEPAGAVVIFVPNWTEQPEPGGVNWTTRKPLSKAKSASSLHPRSA